MSKRKKIITAVIVIAAAAAAALCLWRFMFSDGDGDSSETVYVDTVDNFMGTGTAMVNRFGGVVEAQKSWSVNRNQEYQIKEILVEVGDMVEEGTPLFSYDTESFSSSLAQAQIDLERLKNEYDSMVETKAALEREKARAGASEQANYTIQIEQQELNIKQKEIDIKNKEGDIAKLKENIDHATVDSAMAGVVKSINESGNYNENDTSFITITQVGDYRVKGSVNEQNIGQIMVGLKVIVHSRVDENAVWKGEVTSIDTENAQQNQNGYYYDGGGGSGSSSYNFYVELENSDGLMLGQHVYLEPDHGQGEGKKQGLWLYDYLIDMTDPASPFVWAENSRGRLEKRKVTLGAYDDELMEYEIVDGLAGTDKITYPSEELHEGMKTLDMNEMTDPGVESDSVNYAEEGF